MRVLVCLFVAALAACETGTNAPPGTDAAGNNGGPRDAPAGVKCSKALYDPCVNNTDCTSNNCKLFNGVGFTVCTQACDAANPCPAQAGQAAPTCNNMGICKPAAANACTP